MSRICTRNLNATATWHPYLYPRGLRAVAGACPPASLSLRLSSSGGCVRCKPPPELGVSHRWLPVVHTRDRKHDTAGVWLYYASGCSDVEWDVGRTVMVRNRVRAFVEAKAYLADQPAWGCPGPESADWGCAACGRTWPW